METNNKQGSIEDIYRFRSRKKGARGFSKAKERNQSLMEHFQPLKTNNKVCFVYLQLELQQDRRR